jgi:hypothetical protein
MGAGYPISNLLFPSTRRAPRRSLGDCKGAGIERYTPATPRRGGTAPVFEATLVYPPLRIVTSSEDFTFQLDGGRMRC